MPARVNQKNRTRAALVEAARQLVADGATPSVSEVAETALVSVATAYRYFPTQEALLAEAAMAPLVSALEGTVTAAEQENDPETALALFVSAVVRETSAHEAAFRVLYGRSLEAPPTEGLREEIDRGVGRGGRRPDWLRRVLWKVRGEVSEKNFERLVMAEMAVIGIEALSALRDVGGLSLEDAEEVIKWTALAVLRQARSRP